MDNELVVTEDRKLHIFFGGESWDFDLDNLDVGLLSSDVDIRNKVADALGVAQVKIAGFRVERNEETGSITLYPQAEFGCEV